MRVIRAPLRVSLFGGGTDRPAYYRQYGSTIISFAITRYLYVVHNGRPTGGCRVSYSEVEEIGSLTTAKHTLVQAVAQTYGITEPCTLTIISDVPKGTGLGSSSALAVALCKLAGGTQVSGLNLATTAFLLEHSVSPQVGAQDHLPAAFGDFHTYVLQAGNVVTAYPLPWHAKDIVNEAGLLLYTGTSRDASAVLSNWTDESTLHAIRVMAETQARIAEHWTAKSLGRALDRAWKVKRKIAEVSNDALDAQYAAAVKAGAYGGKLCGAGAGGCWFFLVPQDRRGAVVDALGLTEIPFQVDEKGIQEWEV